MGIAKVIVNGVTTMDVTQTTATADKILQGYGCIGADGEWIDGTATGGGGDSTLVVTISYNESTEMWEPDKTYAEIKAAYTAGNAITVQCDSQSVQNYIVTDGYYGANERSLNYIVSETGYDDEHNVDELRLTPYYLDSNGVGLAEGTQYIIPSDYKQITANGSSIDVTYCSEIDVAVPSSTPTLQSKSVSYTPSETAQSATVTADSGYDGLSSVDVSVGAIPSDYVGTGITRRTSSDLTNSLPSGYYRVIAPAGYYESAATKDIAMYALPTPVISIDDATGVITATATLANSGFVNPATTTATEQLTLRSSTDLTVSGATVTVPAGYYSAQASKAVASGTEGTPTATKGTVSNHAISVTPSVTNSAGYIEGGTRTGTAVTVSASELVSGGQTLTDNGTVDVTNLASVTVDIDFVTYYTSSSDPTSSQGSDGDIWLVTA